MFRNYLAAALRNLARNKLYAGVTIFGLAIGFAAALLIGLYVREELTYDRFIPSHERTYLVTETLIPAGSKAIESQVTPMMLARPLALDFPEVEAVARLSPSYFPPTVRRGTRVATEPNLFWGDPSFLRVVPLPILAGDPATALEAPDGVVVTRSMARKYFGKDFPLGEILTIERQPFRVTAVMEDLPSASHLTAEMIASARAPSSPITQYEHLNGPTSNTLATYVRLKPAATVAAMAPRFPAFLETRLSLHGMQEYGSFDRTLHLVRLDRVHLTPSTQGALKAPADVGVVLAIGGVGVLIVIVAAINFVTLMTARGARRAVEVGIRKAAGADRRHLIVQFLSEALVYVLAAGLLALSLAELLLPAVNAVLQRKLKLDYVADPDLLLAVAAVLLLTGLLAGAYPALVLSAFRPAAVLKGGLAPGAGGARVRQALVVGQFAVLVVLALGAMTIARQTLFALNEGLHADKHGVTLLLSQPCSEAMRDEVRRLPGVTAASCASYEALSLGDNRDGVVRDGRKVDLTANPVDYDFLELFGIKPVAGRLFDRRRPADGALDSPDTNPPVVLNESAVRKLHFASPQAAIGKIIVWHGFWDESLRQPTPVTLPMRPSEIVGVVPDFTLGSIRQPILPSLYSIGRNLAPNSVGMVARLDKAHEADTTAAIDRLWQRFGGGKPVIRFTMDRFLMRSYLDTLVQGLLVAVGSVIALIVAALGLFALSAFTTERRTKEIGVRKAMGASSADILKLLLWQFAKPVLVANLIAWPAAWLILRWWLAGFAYHVDVAPWTFAAAGAGALTIALATVFVHALAVARAKPVGALRYE